LIAISPFYHRGLWDGAPAYVEGGALFERPEQRFGRTTYVIPEAQIQYRWRLGRVSPFVGGGVGAALDFRNDIFGGTQADLALSTGGGLRAKLTETLGVGGEFRLRGLGRDFSGSAAEIRGGLFWTF
jgi:opacity protein-like surface antigen